MACDVGLSLSVGRGGAALDVANLDNPEFPKDIKQKPPVADTAAKGDALVLEPLDVTGERV